MLNTNKIVPIMQINLKDIHSFKEWLKNSSDNIDSYDIQASHLLIYLNFIKTMVMKEDNIDRVCWLDLIKNLESKISFVKRVET